MSAGSVTVAATRDPEACPVAALLPEITATLDALHAVDTVADEARLPSPVDMEAALSRRLSTLQDLAAQARARSLRGALLQVILASADADMLADNADDDWTLEANRLRKRVDGYLYSVLRLLEELAGEPLDEDFGYFWMHPAADPHAALEESHRLAREAAA